MRNELRQSYNALQGFQLGAVVRDIGLTGTSKQVAFSGGLGDAVEHRREQAAKRRAKTKQQKAARRKNR